jgi:hypothetical protein
MKLLATRHPPTICTRATTMRIPRRILVFALAALAASGCSDSNAPDASFVGSYALISVDGETLPLSIIDQPSLVVTLQSSSLLLNANKTFTQTATLGTVGDTLVFRR